MNEQQNQQPHLEGIRIAVDGELDKINEVRRFGVWTARTIGYVAYRALETTVNVLDEFVQSAQPKKM